MFDFVRSTLSSAMSMITSGMSEVKQSSGSDPASCPIPNTTLPVLTQCPASNGSAIQEYLDGCLNSVPTPDLIDECMKDCVNCCPSNSTINAFLEKLGVNIESMEKNIQTLVQTFVDCGQPPSPPDEKSKSSSALGYAFVSVGGTAYLVAITMLARCCKAQGLTKGNLMGFRMSHAIGAGCVTAGLYILSGGTASVLFGLGSLGVHMFSESVLYKRNMQAAGLIANNVNGGADINAAVPLLNPAAAAICPAQCPNPFTCC